MTISSLWSNVLHSHTDHNQLERLCVAAQYRSVFNISFYVDISCNILHNILHDISRKMWYILSLISQINNHLRLLLTLSYHYRTKLSGECFQHLVGTSSSRVTNGGKSGAGRAQTAADGDSTLDSNPVAWSLCCSSTDGLGWREPRSHTNQSSQEKVAGRKMGVMGSCKGSARDRQIIACLTFWCLDGRKEDE